MLAISLGVLLLSICWLAAHFLTATTTYLLPQRIPEGGTLSALMAFLPARTPFKSMRVFFFTMLVFAAGTVLAVVNTVDPIHNALFDRIRTLLRYQLTHRVTTAVLDFLLLFLGLFLAFQFLSLLNQTFPKLMTLLDQWGRARFQVVKIQSLELLTPDQITDFLLLGAKILRWGVTLFVGALSLTLVFNILPWTQGVSSQIGLKLLEILAAAGRGLVEILPNLFSLFLITLATVYSLKLLTFFFHGFRTGKVRLPGFHPELVEPTFQILRFLVLAFALVAAFPYIPGSDSPVFRGLSIFVGFLLSLGSTSLISNIIAGVVVTYTRGLRIGDRVRIGEAEGDVIERTWLVTRVRTIKNVDITIPNGMLLNNHIVNYSAAAEETGVVLNTAITIGYDVPWRLVHELLIESAAETAHVLPLPEPFVLQVGLEDAYVRYELNAYTMKPGRMALIYSELHQNIQDKFNEAEIEILSPAYTSLRDGGHTSIPQDYLPKNYEPPTVHLFPAQVEEYQEG